MIILLIVGLIKKTLYKMSQYFPKPYEPFGADINVKVDLSNYATKADIENITHVDTSNFALKTNLANLKTEVDKLNIDKLVPVPTDLSKLSNVVKNDVIKKDVYDKLVAKINNINIDTGKFILKSDYDADKTKLENKIPDASGFPSKTALATVENKIPSISNLSTIENKIPDVSNLVTKAALTTVENKIPSISNLVKKTDYHTNVGEIENRMISRNRKIVSNKTKDISIENELKN